MALCFSKKCIGSLENHSESLSFKERDRKKERPRIILYNANTFIKKAPAQDWSIENNIKYKL